MKPIYLFIIVLLTCYFVSADDMGDLMNDIGNEISIGGGFGYHTSRNDYIADNFVNMNFYRISLNSYIGSRDIQLRFLAFGHYSDGVGSSGGYITSSSFTFFELNGALGFLVKPIDKIYIPAIAVQGSFNYYYMGGESRVDPGFYTSLVWNIPTSKGFDYGFELYNNFVFDKLNSDKEYGNSGDYGFRVYIAFIGTIRKADEYNNE